MSYGKLNPLIKKFILVVFLYGLTSAAFNGFFGIYVKELGYPESSVGAILSLRRLAVGLFTLLIVIIAGKIGQKRTLMAGLLTVGLSSIAIVLTENLEIMKIIAVIFGFGQAAMMTIESPFIYDQTSDEERIHAFSLTFATRNAAFMTGSLLTGFLSDFFSKYSSASAYNIRMALIIVSALSLLAIFPLGSLKPKPQTSKKKNDYKDLLHFFNMQNILFIVYTGLIGLGAGMVVPFFGVYLKYMLNTSEGIVGLILSFAQLGTVFGGLSVPILSKKIGHLKTIIATQLLSIPMLIIIGFPQGILIVAIAFFLRSSLMNMGQPLIRTISMEIVEEHQRPLMSSMRAMINNLARALGIYIGGYLMTNYTYNTPYALTILCYLMGSILFFNIFKEGFKTNKSVQI